MEPVKLIPVDPDAGFLDEGSGHGFRDQVLEHVTNAVFALDLAGRFTLVNHAGAEITGYAIDELIGKPFTLLFDPGTLPEAMLQFQRAATGETVSNYVVEIARKDSARRLVNLNGSPLYENGRITGVVGMAEDITERRQAEQNLRASEERFRATFEEAAVGMGLSDLQGRLLRVNRRFCDILGYTREELLQKTILDITHPEDLDKNLLSHIQKTGHDASSGPIEKRYLCKDGSVVWAELSGSMVRDANGQPTYYIGVINDISERKRVQQELEFRNTILLTQQETSLAGILVADGAGGIISFNQRFVDIWGIPPEVVESRSDERALQSVLDKLADPAAFMARVKYLYEHRQEKSSEEIALKDGRVLERYSAPMFGTDQKYCGRVWYFHDITGRKQAQHEIERKNTILLTQQETSPDAILLVDEHATIISYNRGFIEMWAIPEELVKAGIDEPVLRTALAQVENPEAFLARVIYLYESRTEKSRDEFRLRDGRIIDRFSAPVIGPDGEYYGRIWQFRDITARKLLVQALAEKETRLRTLVQTIPDLTWLKDRGRRLSELQPGIRARPFGVKEAEIVGKTDYDFVDKELAEFFP